MSKPKSYVRSCAICGRKFKTDVHNKITCSTKCYKARKSELKKKRTSAKRKLALKPTKRVKCVEKVVLPKRPSLCKTAKKQSPTRVFIDLRSTDPYRLFFAGAMLEKYAIARIGNEAKKWEGAK